MKIRQLGSAQLVRGATVACSLLAGAHFGCGKVVEAPDLGAPSGGTLGANSTGGTTATSSGGVVGATGGGLVLPNEEPPAEPEPCESFPDLDPPCSEQDLHGDLYYCRGASSLSFEFPLTALTPPADNLRLVCLPVDPSLGVGGMGGSGGLAPAVGFDVAYLRPGSAGDWSEDTFSIAQPADSVGSQTYFSEGLPAECVGTSDTFAQVAVVQEETILVQRRLLLHTAACLK